MKKWIIATIVLFFSLIATNGYWFYNALDSGVSKMYADQVLYERAEMLKQLLKLAPSLANGKNKIAIIADAEKLSGQESFEKDGKTFVGWLVFTFDQDGKLIEIAPPWDYGEGVPPL